MSNGGSIDEGRAERERRKKFRVAVRPLRYRRYPIEAKSRKKKKEMNEKDEKQNKKRT